MYIFFEGNRNIATESVPLLFGKKMPACQMVNPSEMIVFIGNLEWRNQQVVKQTDQQRSVKIKILRANIEKTRLQNSDLYR